MEERSNPKIFDRSVYSSTTISVFQIVGAYFVDVYYNHLYTEAIKFKTEGKVASVTEGYRHSTFAFLTALDNKAKGYKSEHYNKLIQGINEYFIFWTTYSTLTLSECIDKIVREFIPADYFASLNKEQKRNILRSVLIDSIREFTKIVIGEFLVAIIDNHSESANVEALKEKIVDTFIMQRETMFHKFLNCRTGGRFDEKVDKTFVDKLRNEVIRLNQQNQELVGTNKNLTNQLDTIKNSAEEIVRKFKLLKNKYDSLNQEYHICKSKMTNLEELISMDNSNSKPTTSIFEDDEPDIVDSINQNPVTSKQIVDPNPATIPATKPTSALMTKPVVKSTLKPSATLKSDLKLASKQNTKPELIKKQMGSKLEPKSIPKSSATSKPIQKDVLSHIERSPIIDSSSDKEDSDDESKKTKEIRIPIIPPVQTTELPSKNEMDEVIAKYTDQSLGKPSDISDIY